MAVSKIRCYVCDFEDVNSFAVKNGYNLFECKNCGFVFVFPHPDESGLQKFYNYKYQTTNIESVFVKKDLQEGENLKHLEMVERYQKSGRLLEIGSGWGFLLSIAQKRGWECTGVERASKCASFAQNELNLNIKEGSFLEQDFPPKYFNAVIIIDILEHLRDPKANLKKVWEITEEGGIVLIQTPNMGSVRARLMKSKWPLIIPPEHISYFSKKSLNYLLLSTGFKIILKFRSGGVGLLANAEKVGGERIRKFMSKYAKYLEWARTLSFALARATSLSDNIVILARK